MKIRLGYVALSKTLDITTSKTVTYTEYLKTNDKNKIIETVQTNLDNLYEILKYNEKNNIHFYRLSSKLIPLADIVSIIDNKIFDEQFKKISQLIKKNNMRIDFHPDQFTVLNSTKKEVVSNTIKILKYHYEILKKLNIKNKIIILHLGSGVLGKPNSIKRFINNFNTLPKYIKKCITLENDDKVYNVEDILNISKTLNIPVTLDIHHHNCNHINDITNYFPDILNTWENNIPKMHFSTPKSKLKKEYRSHNDYIDVDKFIEFIDILKIYNRDIDIMLEAKAKDDALFRLVRLLKYKTNYQFIDDTTFIV